ncbi:hypothetical protein ACM66B_003192 [Microbotryomycetes sp. NB124-2]
MGVTSKQAAQEDLNHPDWADETLLYHPRRKHRLFQSRRRGYSDSSDDTASDSDPGTDTSVNSPRRDELPTRRRGRENETPMIIMGVVVLLLLVAVIGMGVYLIMHKNAERDLATISNQSDPVDLDRGTMDPAAGTGEEGTTGASDAEQSESYQTGEVGRPERPSLTTATSESRSTAGGVDKPKQGQNDEKPKDNKPKDDKPKEDKPKDEKPQDDKPKDEGGGGGGNTPESTGPKLDKQFSQALEAHNKYRALHGVPPLEWDTKAASAAKKWFDNCVWEHSKGAVGSYGENLFAVSASGIKDPTDGIGSWYNEIKEYDFNKGGFSHDTGHFTQLVWKDSKRLGCYIGDCDLAIWEGMNTFLVCEYEPAGNVGGGYDANVPRPK